MKKGTCTVYDIAKEVGVSASTVSRALNNSGYVSAEKRKLILETAKNLNYEPNRVARSLRTRKTNLLAFGIPNMSDPFFSELVTHMQPNLAKHGYDLLAYPTGGKLEKEEKLISLAEQRQVDGIFIVPQSLTEEDFVEVAVRKIPCVVFDSRNQPSVDTVSSNDRMGSFEAVNHLIEMGHTKIGFIGYKMNAIEERLKGYEMALSARGITVDPEWIIIGNRLSEMDELIEEFIQKEPELSAYFCVADIVGVKCILSAQELGFNIPKDKSVMGFNDDFIAKVVSPQLTTMALEPERLGAQASRILLHRINPKQTEEQALEHIRIAPKLVVRDSIQNIQERMVSGETTR